MAWDPAAWCQASGPPTLPGQAGGTVSAWHWEAQASRCGGSGLGPRPPGQSASPEIRILARAGQAPETSQGVGLTIPARILSPRSHRCPRRGRAHRLQSLLPNFPGTLPRRSEDFPGAAGAWRTRRGPRVPPGRGWSRVVEDGGELGGCRLRRPGGCPQSSAREKAAPERAGGSRPLSASVSISEELSPPRPQRIFWGLQQVPGAKAAHDPTAVGAGRDRGPEGGPALP